MKNGHKATPFSQSVTARGGFTGALEVRRKLWGGEFWGKGYFLSAVGQHDSEKVIAAYVNGQGAERDYQLLHKGQMDFELSEF